jgi:isoleucyl-tRNA synthetase
MAPFLPFMSEEMYQNLVVRAGMPGAEASVHLDRYPEPQIAAIDERLATDMRAVRDIVSLGLSVRTSAKLRVRQPLDRADVVFNDRTLLERLEDYKELILDELNVHEVRFMFPGHEQGAVAFRFKPNFRTLGPRLGKGVQAVKRALEAADGSALFAELSRTGKIGVEAEGQRVELARDELEVVVEAAPGFSAETGRVGVVVLHTTLTDELIDEGLLREIINRVQTTRKELGLEFTDRVEIKIAGSDRIVRVAQAGKQEIERECLATSVECGRTPEAGKEHPLGDEVLRLDVKKKR